MCIYYIHYLVSALFIGFKYGFTWLIHVTYLFSSILNTVNSFKKKIVLNENYLTNPLSDSTDQGTSLGEASVAL